MTPASRILQGLEQALHHETHCPKRPGSYTCECGVVVTAPKPERAPEMIERVARALAGYPHREPNDGHYANARIAIEAMREPTEAMLRAVIPDEPDADPKDLRICRELEAREYRAMIDVALNPHRP